jgi:hypothetical protein
MTGLIIISKGQIRYLPYIIGKISDMTLRPDAIYYLMDRDVESDVSTARNIIHDSGFDFINLIENYDVPCGLRRPMMTAGMPYFLSGFCRNVCIDKAISDGCDRIVCIDGDCIPECCIIEGYNKFLPKDSPSVVCGKRNDAVLGFSDQREHNKYPNIFSDNISEVSYEAAVLDSAVLWSCNIGMNALAVRRIKEINKKYYGISEVFSSIFSGRWGGEDSFLGIECFYDENISLMAMGFPRSGITHIDHPRPIDKYAHSTFLKDLNDAVTVHKYLIENFPMRK